MPLIYAPGIFTQTFSIDGQLADLSVEMVVAEETGLGYLPHRGTTEEDVLFTLVHIPSKTHLAIYMYVSTPAQVQVWIEQLHAVIDWTGEQPKIRQEKYSQLLDMVVIGALFKREVPS